MGAKSKKRDIVDYKTVVEQYVTPHLSEGWELYGNPFIGNLSEIYQAVVKFKEEDEYICPIGDDDDS